MADATITVFHNISSDGMGRHAGFSGYQPGHALAPVARYTRPSHDVFTLAEHAFMIFNVGDDPSFGEPNPLAVEYRSRKNRSLSVGDVVLVQTADQDTWLSCESFGFDRIDVPSWLVFASQYGTTSLDAEDCPVPSVTYQFVLDKEGGHGKSPRH